jgi:hypothetical protein
VSQSRRSRGATSSRSVTRALVAALAVAVVAAVPATAGAKAPAAKTSHRMAPPKVSAQEAEEGRSPQAQDRDRSRFLVQRAAHRRLAQHQPEHERDDARARDVHLQ